MKRVPRAGPAKPVSESETKAAWPTESHSGEGSASALVVLQKIEKRRIAAKAAGPKVDDDAA